MYLFLFSLIFYNGYNVYNIYNVCIAPSGKVLQPWKGIAALSSDKIKGVGKTPFIYRYSLFS